MKWVLAGDRFLLEGIPGALAFTTTRQSGVAAGPIPPWDLRPALARWVLEPAAVIAMEQVHGAAVVRVSAAKDTVVQACDGLVTDRPGVALTMRSADCLPIIVYDPVELVIGLAHAGWRGVQAGLPGALLRTFSAPERLLVGVGPGIGPCCYAVGPEFERWGNPYLERRAGQRFLDLRRAALAQISQAGVPVGQVAVAPWCTVCANAHCASFRRDGETAGRMLTFVLLNNL